MDSQGEQQAIMKQALLSQTIIDRSPNEILKKICAVFDNLNTSKHSVKWLKDKIGSICLNQRDGFDQYLNMKKFNVLTPQAMNILKQGFQQIWKNYQTCHKKTKKNQKILKYMPKLQTQQQTQRFHLSNLQTYLQSFQCPLNYNFKPPESINSNFEYFPPIQGTSQLRKQRQYEFRNRMSSFEGFASNNQFNYPYYNMPCNNSSSMPINLQMDYNYRPIFPNYIKEKSKYQNKPLINISSSSLQSPQKNKNKQKNGQKEVAQKKQTYKVNKNKAHDIPSFQEYNPASESMVDEQQQQRQVFHDLTSYENSQEQQMNSKFRKCVCKGKKVFKKGIQNQQNKYFECNQCGNCMHYECLKINTDLKKQQYEAKTKCIICKLQEINQTWYDLYQPPLAEGWFLCTKEERGKDIYLQQEIFNNFFSKNKKQEKMINQNQDQDSQEQNVNKQYLIIRILRIIRQKQEKNSQNNQTITLDQDSIDHLGKMPKSKISLEFSTQNQQKSKRQPFYSYYGIYRIAQKTQKDIVQKCMRIRQQQKRTGNYSKSWVTRYFESHPQQNQFTVDNFQQISNPFRGNNCKHTKFLNLNNQLQHIRDISYNSYKQAKCYHCGQAIDEIELDFDLIQKIKQCSQFPQKIIYQRTGVIRLVYNEEQKEENGQDFENIQIGQNIQNVQKAQNAQNIQNQNKIVDLVEGQQNQKKIIDLEEAQQNQKN